MKIGSLDTKPRPWRIWLAFTAVFLLGLWLGQAGWADGWLNRLTTLVQSPPATAANLPILRLDIPFDNYNQLLQQREEALPTAVILAQNDHFQPATLQLNSQTIHIHLRLREGLANLGPSDKWPFEGRVRPNSLPNAPFGFTRFELIDPAHNNWLAQHAFNLALQRDGLLVSRTRFVRLYLNGDDRGLYAMQEGFGTHLPPAQNRPAGALFEYGTDPLWTAVRHVGNPTAVSHDPLYQRTYPLNSFNSNDLRDNPIILAQSENIHSRFAQWQQAQYPTTSLFDAAALGRFLAHSQLWGAVDGLTIANARYYANESGLLEPIAYNGNPLTAVPNLPFPPISWADEAIIAAYYDTAQTLTDPAYLLALQNDLDPQLRPLLAALQTENPSLTLPWDTLRQRQTSLRQTLQPAQPLIAQLNSDTSDGYLRLALTNPLPLPQTLVHLQFNNQNIPLQAEWLQQNRGDGLTLDQTAQLAIPLTALPTADLRTPPLIRLASHLPHQTTLLYTEIPSPTQN